MIVPSLVAFSIACLAVHLSINTSEEIVKIAARGTALFCLFLSLVYAPWSVLLVLIVPVLSYRLA